MRFESPLRVSIPAVFPLLLLSLLGLPAAASGYDVPEADTFEPWHLSVMRQVTDARISEDGQAIAYVLSVPRRPLAEENGPAWSELHLLRRDDSGGGFRSLPFVTGEVNVSDVAWTPLGEISFLAKRDGDEKKSLYVIPRDGGEARRVLQHETDIADYSWAPDGNLVAFLAAEEKPEVALEREKHGFEVVIYEEDRPFTRLFVATLDTEAPGSEPEVEPIELVGSVRAVRFGPDGGSLMATVTPTPLIDDSYTRIKVHVVDLDTGESAIVDNPGKLDAVRFSPDGAHLAMISAADLNDPAAGRLMVAPASGGEPRDLMPGLEGHVSSFRWRDPATLVYVADLGTLREVGTVTLDGEREILVPAGTPILTLRDLTPDGTLLFTGEAPSHPEEIYVMSPGEQPRRVTSSNDWLDDLPLARQEVVEFEARDGLRLEGVLVYPLGYREGERYPLILTVHGGPESHHNHGWLTNYSNFGQFAAARGFAVFYTNYRGSTGRGVEFSKLSQAAAAGSEFDDLIDAVDHLIEIGLVDRDRVGIMGGSYGGYASAWGATHYSDRFAASSPFVGIGDNISKVGTTDIPQEMYDVHHRKWLWEDWDYFAESSPIYWVKRNRTPTLILHGADDTRVHPSQSMELYRHLKVLGQAPVRLVFYPGEGHGNRKAAARLDYTLRVLRWMEHYLKGPGGEPPPYEIDYAAALPWAEAESGGDEEATQTSPTSGGGR